MKMLIERSINVLLYLLKQSKSNFRKNYNSQGPFKQDSAKTNAARTSTCLSVKRLSVVDVIRFYSKHNNQI
jgi:hypothetical protein